MVKKLKNENVEEYNTVIDSILKNEIVNSVLRKLLGDFKLSFSEIEDQFHKYNGDVFAYDNEIYSNIRTRFVQYLNNHNVNSWHDERQKALLSYITKGNFKNIIDIGFGVPSLYLSHIIENKLDIKVTLLDKYFSAEKFAKQLLNFLYPDYQRLVDFKTIDISFPPNISGYDLYIMFDSIEHAFDPNKALKRIIQTSPDNAHFLFCLPVGDLIPCHYIAWDSEEATKIWLKSHGLEIIESEIIHPNLEGDLFTTFSPTDFFNVVVLCRKKI
jgi:SAM-dependent methyltransferase